MAVEKSIEKSAETAEDPRPAVWVGHVALGATDVAKANDFWQAVGMRLVEFDGNVAILELRGGTHLVILPSEEPVAAGTPTSFDLMVDDVDSAHARYEGLGFAPGPIETTPFHRSFRLRDPSGYEVTVKSSHVGEQPV